MRLITLLFLILAILSLVVCVSVRIIENEAYKNIEGQCGVNDNGTCDNWQISTMIISALSFIAFLTLFCISSHEDKKFAFEEKSGCGKRKTPISWRCGEKEFGKIMLCKECVKEEDGVKEK